MAAVFENNSLLLFRVGPVLCCAPSLPVESIIPPPSLTRPPGSDEAKPGIFRHAGHVISSLDLRFKFGVDKAHWKDPGKVIITEIEAGRTGFWVDEIMDVIDSPTSGWGSLPAHLPRGVFSRTLILDNKIFLYAEFEQLYRIPTSGYLREYIEHLLQEQATVEMKQVSGDTSLKTSLSLTKQPVNEVDVQNQETRSIHQVEKTSADRINRETTKANTKVTPLRPHIEKSKDPLTSKTINQINKLQNNETVEAQAAEVNPSQHKQQTRTISSTNNKAERATVDQNKLSTAAKENFSSTTRRTNEVSRKQDASREQVKATESDSRYTSNRNQLSQSAATKIQHLSSNPAESGLIQSRLTNENNNTGPIHKPASHNQPTGNSQEPTTSMIPGLVFLLLIICLISATSWYVLNNTDVPSDKITSVPKPVQSTSESEVTNWLPDNNGIVTNNEISNNHTNNVTGTRSNTVESDPTSTESEPDEDITIASSDAAADITSDGVDATSVVSDLPTTESSSTPKEEPVSEITDTHRETIGYKANILKDDSGITIVLEVPEEIEVFKPVDNDKAENTAQADGVDTESNTITTVDEPITNTLTTQTSKLKQEAMAAKTSLKSTPPKAIQTEIIHIVVKGDTLWHIAIRYVNNPYKYPELARLSNIKNPDLIYPGDRVRIIKRSKPSR